MISVQKTSAAPASLAIEKVKASGSYNKPDVLETNRKDFFNKCYICGNGSPVSLNTEHFKPHRGNIDLKFDWKNLFYACAHCNAIKHAKAEYDDILNCTDPADDVERKINFQVNCFPKEIPRFIAQDESLRTLSTIKLLEETFIGTTALKKLEANNLRTALTFEMTKLANLLHDFHNHFYSSQRDRYKQKVIDELDISLPFAAFKRWAIRNNEWAYEEFSSYI